MWLPHFLLEPPHTYSSLSSLLNLGFLGLSFGPLVACLMDFLQPLCSSRLTQSWLGSFQCWPSPRPIQSPAPVSLCTPSQVFSSKSSSHCWNPLYIFSASSLYYIPAYMGPFSLNHSSLRACPPFPLLHNGGVRGGRISTPELTHVPNRWNRIWPG